MPDDSYMLEQIDKLHEQIDKLQTTVAAHEVLTKNAMEAAGENKASMKAMHKRLDEYGEEATRQGIEVTHIKDNQLTADDIESAVKGVIEVEQGKAAGKILRHLWLIVGTGFTVTFGWLINHIKIE